MLGSYFTTALRSLAKNYLVRGDAAMIARHESNWGTLRLVKPYS